MTRGQAIARSLVLCALGSSVVGCFALFPLDEYSEGTRGPIDASIDGPAPGVDTGTTHPTKRVFITAATMNASFGGVAAGDVFCQDAASKAGLPGTYRAWLSDGKTSPKTRFTAFANMDAEGGIRLPDDRLVDTIGKPIADNWTELLTTRRPLTAIENTEKGAKVVIEDAGIPSSTCTGIVTPVWTNTSAAGDGYVGDSGGPGGEAAGCNGFTSNNNLGLVGIVTDEAPLWTNACMIPCAAKAHLYCFEQ